MDTFINDKTKDGLKYGADLDKEFTSSNEEDNTRLKCFNNSIYGKEYRITIVIQFQYLKSHEFP